MSFRSWAMKWINRLSLRMRLTLLMSALLICACSLFTAVSILSAHKIYSNPPQVPAIKALPPLSDKPNGDVHTQLDLNIDAKNNAFTLSSFVWFGIIIVLGAAATYLLAGKALRPVTDLSQTIEEIDENNLFVQN